MLNVIIGAAVFGIIAIMAKVINNTVQSFNDDIENVVVEF